MVRTVSGVYRESTVFKAGAFQVTLRLLPRASVSTYGAEPPWPLEPWQVAQPKWPMLCDGSGESAGWNMRNPRPAEESSFPMVAPFCRDGSWAQYNGRPMAVSTSR